MIRGEVLADPVDYLAVCPVAATVFFIVVWLLQAVRVEPVIVEQGRHGRLAAPVPIHPRTRAVVRMQVVDTALWLRLDDLPRVWLCATSQIIVPRHPELAAGPSGTM